MVNISKRKISDDILVRLYKLFFEIIYRTSSVESFLSVVDDILTPTEKIMIAKRIGIFYLLIKGVEQNVIAEKLKVSTTTVSKYALIFYHKETELVKFIQRLLTKEKAVAFLEDVFADLFIQPGVKIGHWSSYWEHERQKKRRKTLNE